MKTNSELQRDILDELGWEPSVDAAAIGVTVDEGIVRLTGDVPSYTEKRAAEHAVKHVVGVTGVVDDLKVRLPGKSERTDAAIAHAVVNALEWDTLVLHERITPIVSNGLVKLEGTVDWLYQKAAADRAVRHLTGVTGVLNLIAVQPQVRVDDVKGKIKQAFKRSAEIDAEGIGVDTIDGTVVLYGTVQTWAERDEAERSAQAAPGVVGVENHITVA